MLNLRADLAAHGSSQSDCARHVGVSTATISLAINFNRWPKARVSESALKDRIRQYLTLLGASPETVAATFNEAPAAPRANAELQAMAQATHSGPQTSQFKDEEMLPRKHTITPDARDYFNLDRDPFNNEVRSAADLWMNDNIRRVRAAVRNVAQHGGMLAVIAESGAGKSTLRKDLAHWIKSQAQPVIVIEPYILGMEDSARKGRPLRAEDITTAVINRLLPGAPIRQSDQRRKAQMHEALRASSETGNRHILIIEEGHRLARETIRHFKGFFELEDGFTSLLSILIIGQTELDWKLGENDFDVREVVQRLEKRYLDPIDNDVEGYLRHKFERVGANYDKVMAPDAAEAIVARLYVKSEARVRGQRTLGPRSQCHPLAINNLVSGAINLAHQGGEERVTGKLITQVDREE
ncbi:ExeA family protein [Acidovorax kalamii]|uniref:ExeA family protein n=1 Tax=Acidovorax kalamii TaxID=2004485 RepID=UPI002091AB9D|nr:AAA family ATPase [Acidovorax kalamii]MCO5354213.1 AAA family ATPase [Acidovorax kalamii]